MTVEQVWAIGGLKWINVLDGDGERTMINCYEVDQNGSLEFTEMVARLINHLEHKLEMFKQDGEEFKYQSDFTRYIKQLKEEIDLDIDLLTKVERILYELSYNFSVRKETREFFIQTNNLFVTKEEAQKYINEHAYAFTKDAYPCPMVLNKS